ncbi:MAG: flagellar hook-length control protein FliK, partial [Phyllobacteriaceae bacterium]|nr:flagellar hook-length control protein FliK [Phyllobacteriaceae bacterium]
TTGLADPRPARTEGADGDPAKPTAELAAAATTTAPSTGTDAASALAAGTGTGTTGGTAQPVAVRLPTADVSPAVAATAMAAMADVAARRIHQGTNRFSVRLDPAELGSVDVRVDVKADGSVSARLVVERADTLDMMLRDQKTLERALSSAGLDVSSGGLQFSMRDGGTGSGGGERAATPAVAAITASDDASTAVSQDTAVAAYRTARAGGVDLRI